MSTSYLLLHGLGGSGPEHWQTWLCQQLIERGHRVYYPRFPDHDLPSKEVWLGELNELMASIPQEEELIVLTHSLGCLLWLHYAANESVRRVRQAVLVCPPAADTTLEEISSFFPLPPAEQITLAAEDALIIQSSNDEYCSPVQTLFYQQLGVPVLLLPHMGHINTASGHGPWPLILELALTGAVPVQQMLASPARTS
ncbi:RBBP9/YdeN family alpha/beta hydrolase [Paenibacillus wulumuqiensis]|uniref:RBBP9/YdeN family alpha/beta hydrolase n=1 Tax=Paenibacillus wulumuqiensis TaxID=1567107 RepID=UPI0006984CF6|nr:alpha/beta fold hydrolase [Paenibacillus wulumuqiensis]